NGDPGGVCRGKETLDDRVAIGFGEAPPLDQRGVEGKVGGAACFPSERQTRGKAGLAGRERQECVGLGRNAGDEYLHMCTRLPCLPLLVAAGIRRAATGY